MTLSEKLEKMKIEIKYKVKAMLVHTALNSLSDSERENIKKCVGVGVSFWTADLYEDAKVGDSEQIKTEKTIDARNFDNYLTISALYDLVVKNQTYSYIHNSWSPDGILLESVKDAGVTPLYFPFKTHMYLYRDRVELDGVQYYNVMQDEQSNDNDRVAGIIKSRVKSFNEFSGLFKNQKDD